MTCEGLTKKGERCKKLPSKHNTFCYLHIPESEIAPLLTPETNDCSQKPEVNCSQNSCVDLRPKKVHLIPMGIRDVDGDGYCFWRALSVCFNDNEHDFRPIMRKCFETKAHDETISATWVELWEIPVIAKLLDINITIVHIQDMEPYVYYCSNKGISDSFKYNSIDTTNGPCIFFTGNHYMAIIRSKNVKWDWDSFIERF